MKHPPQEPDAVPSGLVTAIIGLVIVAIGVAVVIMRGMETHRTRELRGDPRASAVQRTGVPGEVNAMETAPFALEAQGIMDHELAGLRLGRYGWVDRARQIVHVPIGVAFDLYLARQQAAGAPQARRGQP